MTNSFNDIASGRALIDAIREVRQANSATKSGDMQPLPANPRLANPAPANPAPANPPQKPSSPKPSTSLAKKDKHMKPDDDVITANKFRDAINRRLASMENKNCEPEPMVITHHEIAEQPIIIMPRYTATQADFDRLAPDSIGPAWIARQREERLARERLAQEHREFALRERLLAEQHAEKRREEAAARERRLAKSLFGSCGVDLSGYARDYSKMDAFGRSRGGRKGQGKVK